MVWQSEGRWRPLERTFLTQQVRPGGRRNGTFAVSSRSKASRLQDCWAASSGIDRTTSKRNSGTARSRSRTRSDNRAIILKPPNAQHEAPASTAPKPREILSTHEAGHAVVTFLLYGAVAGVRLDGGGGVVWFGDPPPEDRSENPRRRHARGFAIPRTCCLVSARCSSRLQQFAKWRNNTIVALTGQEAERLAFGLVVSPENSDQLSAKMYCRRLFGLACGCQPSV